MRGFDHTTILSPRARSIQPNFRPVRPGKEDHLKKVDHFFSKLFRLDRTDPLSFGPEFLEILVEWIAPPVSTSLETQGRSVGSEVRAGRKFSGTFRPAFSPDPTDCP